MCVRSIGCLAELEGWEQTGDGAEDVMVEVTECCGHRMNGVVRRHSRQSFVRRLGEYHRAEYAWEEGNCLLCWTSEWGPWALEMEKSGENRLKGMS